MLYPLPSLVLAEVSVKQVLNLNFTAGSRINEKVFSNSPRIALGHMGLI